VKTVVSVSLGSSTRDHRAVVELLGERVDLSRVGVDGSLDRALARLRALDGMVDAIGLGGIDVYLYAGTKRYALRDGVRLLEAVKSTPVLDGSGLKNTLERQAVAYLRDELGIELRGTRRSVAKVRVPQLGGRRTLAGPGRFAGSNQVTPAP